MELEKLKALWQEVTPEQIESKYLKAEDLKKLLKGKTRNVIQKINRSIKYEVGMLIVLTLAFASSAFWGGQSISQKVLFGLVILLCSISGIYYWFKYRQINQIDINTENLKDSLETLISTIEYYLKIYFYGSMSLIPLSYLTGYFYGYTLGSEELWLQTFQPSTLWIGLGSGVVFTLLMIPVLKWYLRKLYANYLEELKDCHQELVEELEPEASE